MTNKTEVSVSPIKSGDLDANREPLPKENLFGRWATHPQLGRGIVINDRPDPINNDHPDPVNGVWFARAEYSGRRTWTEVHLEDLTLDPVDLITLEDFENAPEGTIIESSWGDLYRKSHADHWKGQKINALTETLVTSGPWKILRWGWGK